MAPVVLLWGTDPASAGIASNCSRPPRPGVRHRRGAHGVRRPVSSRVKNYPLEFLCVPFFVWVAFRFTQRETAAAIVALAGIATWGTLHGYGPFVRGTLNESLLLLQAYMVITSVTTLALAALVSEHLQVEARLRQLSVSDPLTGLANHRQLMYAVDTEIKRSQRTERRFAIVLLDLDRLKQTNDRYGHAVGSHALCRVAEALLVACRGVDTAARFGGDEFALVLPETSQEAAWHVARETAIANRFEALRMPVMSVSVGVAVYPGDGSTVDQLLAAADRSLYESKEDAHRASPVE